MQKPLSQFWKRIQEFLPGFTQEPEFITSKHLDIMYVLDEIRLEDLFPNDGFISGRGRPKVERVPLARAFIAKAIINIDTTKLLIERIKADPTLRRICGWNRGSEVPCEATFSNVFSEFSENRILEKLHANIVIEAHKEIPIHHVSRDSTEIDARERPKPKNTELEVKQLAQKKYPRGRPKKGENRPQKEPKKLERQRSQGLEQMLRDLPCDCDKGTKKNAKGYCVSWNGYKLHADVVDGGVAVACILTSASVHDSQVSIPLEITTSNRVVSYYTLADSAYDAADIKEHISSMGKIAIIDNNPRRGEKIELTAIEKSRYKNRTAVERLFSELKDSYGASKIWVKGHAKVMCHIMFGVICHTVIQLRRLSDIVV